MDGTLLLKRPKRQAAILDWKTYWKGPMFTAGGNVYGLEMLPELKLDPKRWHGKKLRLHGHLELRRVPTNIVHPSRPPIPFTLYTEVFVVNRFELL